MTFAIFIILVLGLFIAILNILPTAAALSFSFTPAVIKIIAIMHAWDYLFPIHELIQIVGVMIVYELGVWIWHVLFRVAKFIRGHTDGA